MNIMEELFSGASKLPDILPNSRQSYFREKNRITQHFNTLVESLSEDELKTFEKLTNCEHRMAEMENMRFFVNGFKSGMNFVLDAFAQSKK